MKSKSSKFQKRTFLDPIHGPIELFLDDPVENLLSRLIDTSEFQRLRRIKQMGTGWFSFHGAEHSRFGHSMGAMHIASKVINHLSKKHFEINKFEIFILVAALLHDIGHGPFSHSSEKICGFSHEDWTKRIILENTQINKLLKSFDKDLPSSVIKVLDYKKFPNYVSQIISSYIDCDRLDYLYRDSYYVGVPYGLTGSNRIISSLDIDSGLLVVDEKIGLDTVIHYLHARYSMYQQVYQHKKNLASDFLISSIGKRMKEIRPKNIPDCLLEWLNVGNKKINNVDLDAFLMADDYAFFTGLQNIINDKKSDKVLSSLSNAFLNRKLFKSLEFRHDIKNETQLSFYEKVKKIAKNKGFITEYFVGIQESSSKPYEPYEVSTAKTSKAIFIKQKNGDIKELSKISNLVKVLSKENVIKKCLVFTPEIAEDIYAQKGLNEIFK